MDIDEWTVTKAVLAAQDKCPDKRLKEVVGALVKSLHGFAREVRLTEAEWLTAMDFLRDAGSRTADKQQFMLLSDTLGLSTLVTAQNHPRLSGLTESTVLGPCFSDEAPSFDNGADISNGAPGQRFFVSGTVRGRHNAPVVGAEIVVCHAAHRGLQDPQQPEPKLSWARGKFRSLEDGRYFFTSIVPPPYRIPHDGPVGSMLQALGRHCWRPAHLLFSVSAPGYETLVTEVFRAGGPYLDSDAVFGVRSSLMAEWTRREPGLAPDGSHQDSPYRTLRFDFVLSEPPD